MNSSSTLNNLSLPKFGKISYTDEGSGTITLVFIHGLGGLMQVWEQNIPFLKKNFRCIAMDLPGHGESAKGDHAFSVFYYAEAVAAFIQKLALENCVVVGHSMGGQIAVVLAVRYPVLLEKLVLVAPAGFEKFTAMEIQLMRNYWNMMQMTNASSWQGQMAMQSNFYKWSPAADRINQAMAAMMEKGNIKEYMRMMQLSMWGMLDEPVFDILNKVSMPVLVVFGEKDALIPNPFFHSQSTAELAAEATKQFPDAKLLMIPHCGHYLQYERPAVFNQAVMDFVRD